MRDPRFSIIKALAIICVVASHAGTTGWFSATLYLFHVPAFFLCAGYFFNTAYLNDERTYLVRRIKGVYLPFMKWSIFFLLVHNLLFPLGLLSEKFGNATGVTHPYTLHQASQHLWSIVCNMSGYDQFLAGAFWFFRAFFIASIIYFALFKILSFSRELKSHKQVGWAAAIIALALTAWKVADSLSMTGVAQGGYRELMGTAFIAIGFLFRQYEAILRPDWRVALISLIVLISSAIFQPTSMTHHPTFTQFLALPLPAVAGFLVLNYLAHLVTRTKGAFAFFRRGLVYIGDHTIYVFAFHLLAFKLVSAFAVGYFNLPWEAVGGHTVVTKAIGHPLFITLYIIVGVSAPILWNLAYLHVRDNVRFVQQEILSSAIVGCKLLIRLAGRVLTYLLLGLLGFFSDSGKA